MKTPFCAAGALTLLLLAAPAFAGDGAKSGEGYTPQEREYSSHTRYEWNTNQGQVILFKNPVSFEGEVSGVNASHRMLKADNGMTVEVPNMAAVWNGDTQIFAQEAKLGDRVVIHLRPDEPYRVMRRTGDELTIGSYDGVFFVPAGFINDIDLVNLDGDIYRDTSDADLDNDGNIERNERNVRRYDNDLKTADK